MDLLTLIDRNHEIVIPKARQLGISWTLSGYGLWTCLFKPAAKGLFLSHREEDAWDIISKARFMWERLPEFLKVSIDKSSRSLFTFEHGATMHALPSTEDAGRGTDATLVVRDELATHPYGKENYTAISPAIDSGGKLIDLSTINKSDATNHFTERVKSALDGATKRVLPSGLELYEGGRSNCTLIFAGWKLRPMRQEGMDIQEWFDTRIKPKYSEQQIEQEYPETLNDALAPSKVSAVFDVKALDDMALYIEQPKPHLATFDTHNGMVRVYKPPIVSREYCIFTDPSTGVADPFVTIVMDAVTGEGVCTAMGRRGAEDVARLHDMLVRAYNNAYNTGEVNAQAGGVFIDTMVKLDTPNRAPRRDPQGVVIPGKYGWYTTKPIRDGAIEGLRTAIQKQLITIHDKEAIDEMRMFTFDIRDKMVAPIGCHDDWVMAWAGVWQIRKFLPSRSWTISSGKYKD